MDYMDVFHIYVEMDNDKCIEMQLKFQDLQNPSEFIITPKVDRTGETLTSVNSAVITHKIFILNTVQ